jgi:hypothetical protein
VIFVIEQGLFASGAEPLHLLALVRFAYEGRHIVLTRPSFNRAANDEVNRWAKKLGTFVSDLIEEAFGRSLLAYQSTTCTIEAVVEERGDSFWEPYPLRLTLADAVWLAEQPLRIVVENRRNDGAFLRRLMPVARQAMFLQALARGWLRFEHGGGSDIVGYAEGLAEEPRETRRTWAVLDSDASASGQPSKQAEGRRLKLAEVGVGAHMLERRAIENYLPLAVLRQWVTLEKGREKTRRRRAVEAIEGKTPPQKHYETMKKILGERAGAGALYRGPVTFHGDWVQREGFTTEADMIATAIFERL